MLMYLEKNETDCNVTTNELIIINDYISMKKVFDLVKTNDCPSDYYEITDIARRYDCYTFDTLVKKLFFSGCNIVFNDENYKNMIFKNATQQHLKIIEIEKTVFQFITNINDDLGLFFQNFESLYLSDKKQVFDNYNKIINDNSFIKSLFLLDSKIAKLWNNDKAWVYNYLETEMKMENNNYIIKGMYVMTHKYPIFAVLFNVFNYTDNFYLRNYPKKPTKDFEDILLFITNKGDLFDAVEEFGFKSVSKLKEYLYSASGLTSVKEIIRQFIITSVWSDKTSDDVLENCVLQCSFAYQNYIEECTVTENKYSKAIVEGYVKHLFLSKEDTYEADEEFKKTISELGKKYNFDNNFYQSFYKKLSKKEKLDFIYEKYEAINYYKKIKGA